MQRRIKIFAFVGIISSMVNLSLAQGTLQATLLPDPPDGSPLSASVIVNTPDTNGRGPFFPVSYEITVNSNEPVFTVGRIAGGSTTWAFDLDAPTIANGSMFYVGTTDMGAFQIDDMLANRTDFELYAYPTYAAYVEIHGVLGAVPEPQSAYLLTVGLVVAYLIWIRHAAHTNQSAPVPTLSIKMKTGPAY